MNKLRTIITSLALVLGVAAVPLLPASTAHGACTKTSSAKDCLKDGSGTTTNANAPTLQQNVRTITNVLMWIIGVIAVIVIVMGGIRYTTSGGDSGSTKAARETILYAVIGIIVAIMAYAIVNFVVGNFG